MARPKRIEGEPTARQRMEDAFWGMLADMPYHKMTSREVCKRSGVSHNSFYYHFENLDDMARQMLNGLFVPELPLALLSLVDGSGETAARLEGIPDLQQRLSRMRLLVSNGSPGIVGIMALLGSDAVPSESRAIATFAEREVGRGVIRKMAAIARR